MAASYMLCAENIVTQLFDVHYRVFGVGKLQLTFLTRSIYAFSSAYLGTVTTVRALVPPHVTITGQLPGIVLVPTFHALDARST